MSPTLEPGTRFMVNKTLQPRRFDLDVRQLAREVCKQVLELSLRNILGNLAEPLNKSERLADRSDDVHDLSLGA